MDKKSVAEQWNKLMKVDYPMTFEKDKIGGLLADYFNAGYKGLTGGRYRLKRGTVAHLFYKAGKTKANLK